jgi:hypothetical protein
MSGGMMNACILVGKPEEKKSLGRPEQMWVDNIEIDLRVTE